MTTPPPITKDIALFLDFDGVLAEIADTPDGAKALEGVPEVLMGLRDRLDGAIAVVSGRMLDDVTARIAPAVIAGSGSHGVERRRPNGEVVPPDDAIRQMARHIRDVLAARFKDVSGIIVEQKDWSSALHYRGAMDQYENCVIAMKEVVANAPGWEVSEGKMVVEARVAGTSKADPVKLFMAEEPFKGRIPVFVGDDITDEDGMRAAAELGGYGIRVGDGETGAKYRLNNPAEVLEYLKTGLS